MRASPRVIIVDDDDEDMGLVLRVVLRLDGFDVWRTRTADECMAKINELEGKVDIIVVNGHIASDRNASIILKIKRVNSSIKVLVISERYHEEHKTRIMDYGADEFVLKPIGLDTVANKVTMLLAETEVPSRL
jgi:DNA-binding response OmpR family regulator